MNWENTQQKLKAVGYDVKVDGVVGPKTYAALLAYVAGKSVNPTTAGLGVGMDRHAEQSGLTTPARLANFIGQTCHESGGFRYLREIWGPTPAQKKYEGRADLGNTQPGDGHRFLGRGILQITGRANYAAAGKRLGVDLIANPEQAEEPAMAVLTACDFWATHHLNLLADSGAEDAITKKVNGGMTNAVERRKYVARAKGVLG